MKDHAFLNREGYFNELTALIRNAKRGQRIIIATMDIQPLEPLIRTLLFELRTAAGRGVHVVLLIDAHNFLIDAHALPGPLFFNRELRKPAGIFGTIMRELDALQAAGGSYRITNVPTRRFILPVAGRSHIKAAVVDDILFVGGCNLGNPDDIDIMVKWHNKKAAGTIATWLQTIASVGSVRVALGDVDSQATIDSAANLIIDAGVPGQSIIYEEALRLIDDAETSLLITCQYFPGGQTARHLAIAQARGVNVQIYYGHPRRQGPTAPLHHLHQLAQHARRLPASFYRSRLDRRAPKLHAKVLLSEKEALIGSHNYVQQGVIFGTAELALNVREPSFARELRSFIQKELGNAESRLKS